MMTYRTHVIDQEITVRYKKKQCIMDAKKEREYKMGLIQRSATFICATKARNLLLLLGKLVVISEFFSNVDCLLGVDYYPRLVVHSYHFGIAIWLIEEGED